MKIQITAKTVSDAIDKALEQFDTDIDKIDYDVIQEPSKGFLGIGSKPAVVRIWTLEEEKQPEPKEAVKPTAEKPVIEDEKDRITEEIAKKVSQRLSRMEEEQENIDKNIEENIEENKAAAYSPEKTAKAFLEEVFGKIGMEVEIETNLKEKYLDINLKGSDMGVIIGKRGQTLDSLQYLVSLVVNKGEAPYVSISLDTENYRQRRKYTLENLAFNLAKKSKHFKKSISLEPMSPYERRIIHSALQNDRYVTTHSEGDEPYRYVVISPKPYYK